jgi:two-component system OmpR family sensor kinase
VRLVAVLLILIVVALVAVGWISVILVRRHLVDGIDAHLQTVADDAVRAVQQADLIGPVDRSSLDSPATQLPSEFVILLYDMSGQLTQQRQSPLRAGTPGPRVPADKTWLAAHVDDPVTVPATAGDGQWRTLAATLPNGKGTVVVAMDFADVNSTVHLLTVIEAVAGGLVALALAGVTAAVIRSEAAVAAQTRSETRMRRFVADAGHELRTPLSVIRAFADYYRQRPQPQQLDAMVGHMDRTALRMATMVDDLLLLARLDAQRPLQRQPVDVLDVVADAVSDAQLMAPDRAITLTVAADAAYLVDGDDERLRQVVANLLTNAIHHTPDGTPVDVRIRRTAAQMVEIDVDDAGPGLAPEQAKHVFERFYRADPSRTRASGGSGLGLSIVAAVVTAHGGLASLDTAPGRGAIFRITLPLAVDAR